MTKLRIDETKPLEPLIGTNYGVIRLKLGNIHCMTSVRDQMRQVRPKNMRNYPVALRRGWVLTVLELIDQNQDLYRHVMCGK